MSAIRVQSTDGTFNEKWLQTLIHDHPECLPISEIEKGFDRPVAVCMEMPTANGPVDNLLLTADGDIILVETKLWKNQEARRTVVAQALDYASCLFAMDFEGLERACLKGDFGTHACPAGLAALFATTPDFEEASFVDAINKNLRLGRILILVVGDGIRSEVADLAALVQGTATKHFTLALVELAMFALPDGQGLFVCPRTLVQTEMLTRETIVIDDRRVFTEARPTGAPERNAVRPGAGQSITAEQFYEAMAALSPDIPDKLKAFLSALSELGVYPDYQRSLNFRWDTPEGKTVSLGYISRNGEIWTDTVNNRIPHALSHPYVEQLASAWGGDVKRPSSGNWFVQVHGSAPRIQAVVDKLDAWRSTIETLLTALRQRSE